VDTVRPLPAAGGRLVALDRLYQDPPSPAPPPAPSPSPTSPAVLPDIPIVAVGDSVMVGAAPALEHDLPGIQINAQEGRQVQTGIGVLDQLRSSGHLAGAVVVDLGNNGTFSSDQLRQVMQACSGARVVVFVNLKEDEPWTAGNNQVIDGAPHAYPRVVLVDWLAASSPHPDYFWDDGLHLRPQGAQVYAGLIRIAIASG
jgi:lysophospholipase L1-like esterase